MRNTVSSAALVLTLAALLTGCATGTPSGAGTNEPAETDDATHDELLGTWSSDETGNPHLTFNEDGTYTGSDGCNNLRGEYTAENAAVTLIPGLQTLKACSDVDTWLSEGETATLSGTTLTVFAAQGERLGDLTRTSQ